MQRELENTSRPEKAEDAMRALEKHYVLRDEGKLRPAYTTIQHAKDAAPRSPVVREALALAAMAIGEWHEAAREFVAFRRFTGDRKHDPTMAECYVKLGRPQKALEVLHDVTRADGEAFWARAQIARARAIAAQGQLERARDLVLATERAVAGSKLQRVLRAVRDDLR